MNTVLQKDYEKGVYPSPLQALKSELFVEALPFIEKVEVKQKGNDILMTFTDASTQLKLVPIREKPLASEDHFKIAVFIWGVSGPGPNHMVAWFKEKGFRDSGDEALINTWRGLFREFSRTRNLFGGPRSHT